MKRRITLSIALALSVVLVLLTSSDSRVEAQNQLKIVANTGVVPLGPGQELRLTVVSVGGEQGGDIYGVRFRKIEYSQDTCNGGVCKHSIASQNISDVIPLNSSEAAAARFELTIDGHSLAVMVLSNNRNVKVNAMIINTATGDIVTAWTDDNGAPSQLGLN